MKDYRLIVDNCRDNGANKTLIILVVYKTLKQGKEVSKNTNLGLIYIATSRTSGKSYIGKTIQKLNNRKRNHKSNAFNQKHKQYNTHFYCAIRKYGWKNFIWKILYNDITERYLNMTEICAIYTYNTFAEGGYNETKGGDGVTMTKEIREKISKANKGKKRKPVSEEIRRNISKVHKGKKYKSMSEEGRRNISKAKKGKTHTNETRKKISLSLIGNKRGAKNKGKLFSEERKRKISEATMGGVISKKTRMKISNTLKGRKLKQKHIDNMINANSQYWKITKPNGKMEIIKNLSKYCKENNLDSGLMCRVSKGERNHHKNYKVERWDNYNVI